MTSGACVQSWNRFKCVQRFLRTKLGERELEPKILPLNLFLHCDLFVRLEGRHTAEEVYLCCRGTGPRWMCVFGTSRGEPQLVFLTEMSG